MGQSCVHSVHIIRSNERTIHLHHRESDEKYAAQLAPIVTGLQISRPLPEERSDSLLELVPR